MEWRKVKHSNNGDSCFSLLEKIHLYCYRTRKFCGSCLIQSSSISADDKKKKKVTMNSEENGRNITAFQPSLGVINSKAKIQADKGRKCQQRPYQKNLKFFQAAFSIHHPDFFFLFSFCPRLYGSTVYLSRADADNILSSTSVEK